MDMLQLQNERLKFLASQPETAIARSEVLLAFSSKWDGVRVNAAKVLGHWGGSANMASLLQKYAEVDRYGERSGIRKALCLAVSNEDASWLIDCCFEPGQVDRACAIELLCHIPGNVLQKELSRLNWRDIDVRCFHCDLLYRHRSYPDRIKQLHALSHDTDEIIAKLAKRYLTWVRWTESEADMSEPAHPGNTPRVKTFERKFNRAKQKRQQEM
jgi:hypothetical protein